MTGDLSPFCPRVALIGDAGSSASASKGFIVVVMLRVVSAPNLEMIDSVTMTLALSACLALASSATAQDKRRLPPPRDLTEAMLGPYVKPEPREAKEEEERPEYELREQLGPYHHGGFFFRIAGGLAFASIGSESSSSYRDRATQEPKAFDSTLGGGGVATELSLGFSPLSGFVLGVGAYTATYPSLSADDPKLEGGSGEFEFEISQLALLGLQLHLYPWPKRGFFVQAGGGVSMLIMGYGAPAEKRPEARPHTSVGPGFVVGVGHEWFVGPEWSLGVLARIQYAWLEGDAPEGVTWSHKALAPAFLVGASYH